MSNNNIFRIGGIAAILSVVLMLAYFVLPPLFAVGAVFMAIFVFALYRLFSGAAPTASLVGAVLGIGGSVILAAMWLINGDQNAAPQNIATWAGFFAPPLLFGYLAYRHPQVGTSRILALIGIVGGAVGLLNLVVVLIGGGNWAEPNNPALAPLIMVSYFPGMIATLVWMVWLGINLLRMKPEAATA